MQGLYYTQGLYTFAGQNSRTFQRLSRTLFSKLIQGPSIDMHDVLVALHAHKSSEMGLEKLFAWTFVTLFGKTRLNENSVEMHFNPFWMRYNALQRSTMIRNTLLTTFTTKRGQLIQMFQNDLSTLWNALAMFPNSFLTLKLMPKVQHAGCV